MPLPGSAPVAINRVLLRDSAFDRIVEVIQNGTLVPGEKLTDDHLISWLGISRTPIREAMLKLASIGLIELASNRYTRVAIPTRENLEESFELLVACGVVAARHIDADSYADATELRDRIAAMSATGADDSRTKIAAFARVLSALAARSNRRYTVDVMGPQVERVIFNALIALDDDLWDSAEQAGRLREALSTGDAEAAARVLHDLEDLLRAAIARLPKAPASQPW